MFKDYKITYEFTVDHDRKDLLAFTKNYWEERRFTCSINEKQLTGKRGSIFGNLIAFEMIELLCDLKIDFKENNQLFIEFLVNGKFQHLTESNVWDFKLEQIFFQRALHDLPVPEFYADYLKHSEKTGILWFFTLMIKGRKISDEYKQKLEQLTEGHNSPVATKL